MEGMIFSTKGWLAPELVEHRPSVVEDNEDRRVERVDKHLRATGEWIGNDLHVTLKKLPAVFGEQPTL